MSGIIEQLLKEPDCHVTEIKPGDISRRSIFILGTFEAAFNKPLPPDYKKGHYLSVYIGDRLLFAGVIDSISKYHIRLVSPFRNLLNVD